MGMPFDEIMAKVQRAARNHEGMTLEPHEAARLLNSQVGYILRDLAGFERDDHEIPSFDHIGEPTGMVYFVGMPDRGPIKIGYSINVPARLAKLQTACPRELTLLAEMPGSLQTERAIHEYYEAEQLHGEWFRASPRLVAMIRTIQ